MKIVDVRVYWYLSFAQLRLTSDLRLLRENSELATVDFAFDSDSTRARSDARLSLAGRKIPVADVMMTSFCRGCASRKRQIHTNPLRAPGE
jgi:hypothetical protein